MEREEAIDKLQDLWNEVYNEDSDGYDYAQAIDTAIEALSKPVVDITQRDLCKDISCTDCPFMKETCKLMDYVAYADRPHGEWVFNPTDAIDLMFAKPKCSKCGFESSDGGNFCPNCGARMTPYKGGDDK